MGRFLMSCGGGAVGEMLPDVLEPPLHPNHRHRAHSIAFGGSVVMIAGKLHAESPVADFCRGVSCGMVSHLALDLKTPKGLPYF
jgi:membrane-bound metal-dependent hydrolase YbcI (DUF457 family)